MLPLASCNGFKPLKLFISKLLMCDLDQFSKIQVQMVLKNNGNLYLMRQIETALWINYYSWGTHTCIRKLIYNSNTKKKKQNTWCIERPRDESILLVFPFFIHHLLLKNYMWPDLIKPGFHTHTIIQVWIFMALSRRKPSVSNFHLLFYEHMAILCKNSRSIAWH